MSAEDSYSRAVSDHLERNRAIADLSREDNISRLVSQEIRSVARARLLCERRALAAEDVSSIEFSRAQREARKRAEEVHKRAKEARDLELKLARKRADEAEALRQREEVAKQL
eukprot:766532_1